MAKNKEERVSLKKGLGKVTRHTACHIVFMLSRLRQRHPYALHVFINKCINPKEVIPRSVAKILKRRKILTADNKISPTMKLVALASIDINEGHLTINNPIEGEKDI